MNWTASNMLRQIADVETERDVFTASGSDGRPSPVALLLRLKAIGPQIGAVLYNEGLYRSFANRRDVAAYAGSGRRHGEVAQSTGSKASPKPAIRVCVTS